MRKVNERSEIFPVFMISSSGVLRKRDRLMTATDQLLFQGADWDFRTLQRIYDACEQVARDELGLDVYPNQIEVITAEQMLDAYSSVGMPLFYKHWSFGKHFAFQEASYRKGLMGLAYEIVINSRRAFPT